MFVGCPRCGRRPGVGAGRRRGHCRGCWGYLQGPVPGGPGPVARVQVGRRQGVGPTALAGTGSVDGVGSEYQLPGGKTVHLYGGLAFRYWAGTPGRSELVAGQCQFYQAIRTADWSRFLEETKGEATRRVAQEIETRWGLIYQEGAGDLERVEWLVIERDEPDLLERLAAYQEGRGIRLPPGVRASQLSAQDVQRIGRQLARKQPPQERVARRDEHT